MENWIKANLGSICYIKKGEQLNKLALEDAGDYPCINGGILPSGYTDKWNTEQNTITISEGGNSCGFINFLKTNFWSGGHCYSLLEIKNKLDRDFLYYALKGRESLVMDLRVGSGLPNIQLKAIKAFEIIYPKNKIEQSKIAEILIKFDSAISQTELIITKYNRIKVGLIQDFLTKGVDENGNIRNEKTHVFKDSSLGRIPKEWSCKSIGDISERLRSGVTPKGGSNVYQEEGIMLIRSQNVYPYGFKLNDVAYISDELNSRMIGSQLIQNDVLLNITGASIGRSTYVPVNFPKSNVNQHVCAIRLKNSNISKSIFLSTFLNSIYGQNQIYQYINGSNREGINYTQIKEIKLPIFDSDAELDLFIEMISKINSKIESEEIKLNKLKSTMVGVLQDLLSGKKRVTHLIN